MRFRNQSGLLVNDPPTPTVDGIRSREEFRKVLARERAASDRNEHGFSLLIFEGGIVRDPATLREFTGVATRRIRQIDEIGWFNRQRLGVLLPYTSASGAKILAEDLCRNIPCSAPTCTIYTYPGQWLPDESNASGSMPGSDEANGGPANGSSSGRGRRDGLFTNRIPIWKRAVDVAGSLIALVCLSPVFLLVAVVIKVVSPGPVFYKQDRVGREEKVFRMWKFRTMNADADSSLHQNHLSSLITMDGSMTKLDELRDPRIFPFGHIMRRSYLDELPQLINVLRGEMSLVGPRPCLPYEAKEYRRWQTRRFDTLPGMTGLWQVSGKNKTTFTEMIRLDIEYSRRCSFWLDVLVLLKTVPAIVMEILESACKTGTNRSDTVSGEMK